MNLGIPEMLFLFFLALIIFGPKKLPEVGRQLGRALTEFKRASNEFKSQIESEIQQLEVEENSKPAVPPAGSVAGTVANTVASPNLLAPEVSSTPAVVPSTEMTPPAKGTDG